MTLMRDVPLILTLMSFGGLHRKGNTKLSVFWMTLIHSDPHALPSWPTSMNLGPTNMLSIMRAPDYEKISGLIFGLGQCGHCFRKTMGKQSHPMGEVLLTQYIPYEKALKI